MPKEKRPPAAYDVDMFSGDLIDTRTTTQKRENTRQARAEKRRRQQLTVPMFTPQEVLPFGVTKAHPKASLPVHDYLLFCPGEAAVVDARSVEEIQEEADREAQKLTTPMFPLEATPTQSKPLLLTAGATLLLPVWCATTVAERAREQERVVFERRLAERSNEQRRIWEWLHQ